MLSRFSWSWGLVATCFLVLPACAVIREMDDRLVVTANLELAKTEPELRKILGTPVKEVTTFSGNQVLYYRDRWYLIKKSEVVRGEFYGNSRFHFSVESFVEGEVAPLLRGQSFHVEAEPSIPRVEELEFKHYTRGVSSIFRQNAGMTEQPLSNYVILLATGTAEKTFLSLRLAKSGSDHKLVDVWKLRIESEKQIPDRQRAVGMMLAIAQDYFLRNSGGVQQAIRPINDPMTYLSFGD